MAALTVVIACVQPARGQAAGSGHEATSGANESMPSGGAAMPGMLGMSGISEMGDEHTSGSYPKFSFDTLLNTEVAGLGAAHPSGRGPGGSLRLDTRALYNVSDALLIDGLFQFKPRAPRPATDPNHNLFINQGAGREEGGKMKELYVRYGDYRFGKFVQNFGRAYLLLPGPYAADFIEESDEGYEPSEMLGSEVLHVFDGEDAGWRQFSVSVFMLDRTQLHRSYPYDEGRIHLHDGGLGNTRLPQNVMLTYDVLNQPVGHWGQLTYQASAIRWGKPVDAQKGEVWATAGADLAIPLRSSVFSTLRGSYSQLRLYVEATRRDHFKGVSAQTRDFLSASTEYLTGAWSVGATTTQRWTRNPDSPMQKGAIYTTTVGYKLPEQAQLSFNVASESVDDRKGVYVGIRYTRTFTVCSRCQLKGSAF